MNLHHSFTESIGHSPHAPFHFKWLRNKKIHIFIILILVIGLASVSFLAQKNQDNRQRGAERVTTTILPPTPVHEGEIIPPPPADTDSPQWSRSLITTLQPANLTTLKPSNLTQGEGGETPTSIPPPITIKVLAIIYDTHLLHPEFPYYDPVAQVNLLAQTLEEASYERGHAENVWYPNVDIQIVNTIVHNNEYVPQLPGCDDPQCADYNAIINNHNVCNLINTNQIDEVWQFSDRTGSMYEARVAGPASLVFNSNAPPLVRNDCNRPFNIMGLNYETYYDWRPNGQGGYEYIIPSSRLALHSFSHRIENTIAHFIDNELRDSVVPGDNWFEYDGKVGYGDILYLHNYCGNIHWAPNASSLIDENNFHLINSVSSSCNQWNPQHTGQNETINNNTWQNWAGRHHVWWMQNMPGKCLSVGMTKTNGEPMPNWWKLIFQYTPVLETNTCTPETPTLSGNRTAIQVTLNWDAVTGGGEYIIERCSGLSCTNFNQVATVVTSSYTETVTPATLYRYRVKAFNISFELEGNHSNVITLYPTTQLSGVSACVQSTQAVLSWNTITIADQYEIQRCIGANCTNFSTVATISPVSGPTQTWTNNNLTSGTTYRYQVRGKIGEIWGPWSNIITLTPVCPCPAPTISVNRVCKSGGTMDTTWNWNAISGATDYHLELHYATYPNINFYNLPTTSQVFNNTSDRNLFGRVRVYHSNGTCTAPGNWSTMIYTPSCVNPPPTPPPNSCQCDQGVVTLNNCFPGNIPQCSGMSTCQCVTSN